VISEVWDLGILKNTAKKQKQKQKQKQRVKKYNELTNPPLFVFLFSCFLFFFGPHSKMEKFFQEFRNKK
jgi:hypothetical protein